MNIFNIFKKSENENQIAAEPKKLTKEKVRKELVEIAILVFVLFCIRSSVFGNYKIPSGSMIPTLLVGDHLFGNKLAYSFKIPFTKIHFIRWGYPQRGDIVSFKYPQDESLDYTKRVIGIPGDTIVVENDRLIINGKMLDRKFLSKIVDPEEGEFEIYEEDLFGIKHKIRQKPMIIKNPVTNRMERIYSGDYPRNYSMTKIPEKVPAGMYFCMGDNRDNSADSRSWGFVPLENFEGRLGFRWMHIPKNGYLPEFNTIGIIKNGSDK